MIRFLTALVGVVALTVGVAFAQAPTTPPAAPAPPAAAKKVPTAVITMEKGGEIVLEFWPQDAPKHVENFIKLASEKFYDGQRVHRVEPGFVVQFGDPQSKTLPLDDPRMGTGGTGRKLKATPATPPDAEVEVVRPQSTFDPEIVFAACARFDTAVEINCRPERQDPPDELLAMALDWDCKISIDTDAHAPGQLEWQRLGCNKAAAHEIELERIVNTWSADELVDWAGTHPTE